MQVLVARRFLPPVWASMMTHKWVGGQSWRRQQRWQGGALLHRDPPCSVSPTPQIIDSTLSPLLEVSDSFFISCSGFYVSLFPDLIFMPCILNPVPWRPQTSLPALDWWLIPRTYVGGSWCARFFFSIGGRKDWSPRGALGVWSPSSHEHKHIMFYADLSLGLI